MLTENSGNRLESFQTMRLLDVANRQQDVKAAGLAGGGLKDCRATRNLGSQTEGLLTAGRIDKPAQ